MQINCPRCDAKNSLMNLNCENCGFKDVARKNIADRGVIKPILLALLSIIVFPLNLLVGIGVFLIIIKSYIFSYIGGAVIPIMLIGKIFGFFEETEWTKLGLGVLALIVAMIIVGFVSYAFEEEESKPYKILRFLSMFLFPPLLVFVYSYYYKPRLALANISREIKGNLDEGVSEGDAKKSLMAKYKKRDGVIEDVAVTVSGSEKGEYSTHFKDSDWYKYFSHDTYESVAIAYGIVLFIYVFSMLYSTGILGI